MGSETSTFSLDGEVSLRGSCLIEEGDDGVSEGGVPDRIGSWVSSSGLSRAPADGGAAADMVESIPREVKRTILAKGVQCWMLDFLDPLMSPLLITKQ